MTTRRERAQAYVDTLGKAGWYHDAEKLAAFATEEVVRALESISCPECRKNIHDAESE